MRFWPAALLSLTLALPDLGNAQPLSTAPAPPEAAPDSAWQFTSEPILMAGLVYYPTRGTRFFDPMLMTEVGAYGGVPIYADVTQQPYTVVYAPIGRGLVRTYEINSQRTQTTAPVGTAGSMLLPATPRSSPFDSVPTRTHVESIPPPAGNNGVWLEYDGRRWYSSGPAAIMSADRFVRLGEYRGFAVYRERESSNGVIWVEVVKDGPLAPYTTR
jgi:hypothetical protein